MTAQQTFRNTLVVLATLALAYILFVSARIIIVLLVAIIIASAVRPGVLWLERRRISTGLAILLVYGSLLIAIFTLGVLVLPPAVTRLASYVQNEDRLASRLIVAQDWLESSAEGVFGGDVRLLEPEAIQTQVRTTVAQIEEAVPALAGQFGGTLGDFVLVFIMGVYWLTARDQAVSFILSLFSLGRRATVRTIIEEIETTLSTYTRGVVFVATVIGFINFAILRLFDVPNAVTIAFIIGVSTALPLIGGFIGAGTATLLALLSSPQDAVITFLTFVAVQQLEIHWLTPRTMGRSVGLNPILIIVFLFVGFAIGGVVGGLIAVPVAGTAAVLLKYLVIDPRKEEATPQHVEGGILIASKSATGTTGALGQGGR